MKYNRKEERMSEYKFLNNGGINWEWLLCYRDVDAKSVEIYFYERWHKYEEHPEWVDACFREAQDNPGYYTSLSMREDNERALQAISLDGGRTWLDVVNKKYVFHYKEFDLVKLEMERKVASV
jgi:hypothetical protein